MEGAVGSWKASGTWNCSSAQDSTVLPASSCKDSSIREAVRTLIVDTLTSECACYAECAEAIRCDAAGLMQSKMNDVMPGIRTSDSLCEAFFGKLYCQHGKAQEVHKLLGT